MKLDWNFQRGGGGGGGGLRKNPFRGGAIEKFWNHTIRKQKIMSIHVLKTLLPLVKQAVYRNYIIQYAE